MNLKISLILLISFSLPQPSLAQGGLSEENEAYNSKLKIFSVPVDVMTLIFKNTDFNTFSNFRLTCKSANKISRKVLERKHTWRNFIENYKFSSKFKAVIVTNYDKLSSNQLRLIKNFLKQYNQTQRHFRNKKTSHQIMKIKEGTLFTRLAKRAIRYPHIPDILLQALVGFL